MVKSPCLVLLTPLLLSLTGQAQNPSDSMLHKRLPPGYEAQAMEALSHFPELRSTPVWFKVQASKMTAKTRPTFISSFLPRGHRSYIITISNQTIPVLQPILLKGLPRDAQVGLLGHELSHVSDFSQKTTLRSLRDLLGHLSAHWLDQLEYHTDWIAIQHGLGKNLEAWSSFIRNTFHVKYWRGSGNVLKKNDSIERYMNPDTIEKYMKEMDGNHQ
jgi:hypothetical protein